MTTIDPYTNLTNQDFLRLHGDRIPEDLLPRIESLLDNYEDLQMEYSNLEDEVYDLRKQVNELERELEEADHFRHPTRA